MIIKSFYIKEKFVENIDTFSGKRNLIYSKSNSKGKTKEVRNEHKKHITHWAILYLK